jgi:hypothetical protein
MRTLEETLLASRPRIGLRLAALVLVPIVASIQAPIEAQRMNRAAIERIERAPGTRLDQSARNEIAILNAARVRPDIAAAAAAASVDTAPDAVPEPPVESVPDASPDAPEAALPRAGELVIVPLDANMERETRQAITDKIGASNTPQISLQAFGGAIRQLAGDGTGVTLKSYVLAGQPLRFEPETQQFVGTILIGVADLASDASRTLTTPLLFQVVESGLVAPPSVELRETSPPYKEIAVSSPVLGTITLRVVSNFSREGVAVPIPIEPTLIVAVDGGNLRAFGMQSTGITVTAVGGEAPVGRSVTFSAPGAFLEKVDTRFDEHGVARGVVRTDQPGMIVVQAASPGYASGERTIAVVLPWVTLAFASVGGLVGGFIRLGPKIKRGMNVVGFLVGMAISVLLGVLVFALYVLGVNVLPVTFGVQVGDLLAFAAAALAGWLGTSVLPVAK